jgi:glycosyltransferase involved in cell wall biosynthesis
LGELAKRLDIAERVTFVGRVARNRIPQYLSAANVFVSGTERESISMALLEALACGVPAVCGPVGGAREVLTDPRTGVVVDDVSPEALACGVDNLLQAHGGVREACVEAAKRFSSEQSNRMILDALEDVGHSRESWKGRMK